MSLTSLGYITHECSKCTNRSNESVYATIRSAHAQYANAVHLWNRCCCNSARM